MRAAKDNPPKKQLVLKISQQHMPKLCEVKVGDTVQVPVPEVDRGPGYLLHVLVYITRIKNAKSLYKLASKHGVLSGMYSRNQFHILKLGSLT